jgi:hypothetical protein
MNACARKFVLVLASAGLAAGVCACRRGGATPGQKIDRALDKTGDLVKEAGEAIKPDK